MPTIKIKRNPNFRSFWNITSTQEHWSKEVQGRAKAVRIAVKIARSLGEDKIIQEIPNKGWQLIAV